MPTHSRNTILLATDQQRSVLSALNAHGPHPIAYSPYGHRPAENGLLSLLGFNGEPPDPLTGCFHLGNGYRQFNPVLMRFNSPDSWSPFGAGGLNAYGYCLGNPITGSDRTGHTLELIKPLLRRLGFMKQSASKGANNISETLASHGGASTADQMAGLSNTAPMNGGYSNLVGTYKFNTPYQRLEGSDYIIYIKNNGSNFDGYDNIKIKGAVKRPESDLPDLTNSDFDKFRSWVAADSMSSTAMLENNLMLAVAARLDETSPQTLTLLNRIQSPLRLTSTSARQNVVFKKTAGNIKVIRQQRN